MFVELYNHVPALTYQPRTQAKYKYCPSLYMYMAADHYDTLTPLEAFSTVEAHDLALLGIVRGGQIEETYQGFNIVTELSL